MSVHHVQVPPFKFGYEYSYTMLVLTITLFYSTIVPIILPAGLIFISIKHFIDKVRCFTITLARNSPAVTFFSLTQFLAHLFLILFARSK